MSLAVRWLFIHLGLIERVKQVQRDIRANISPLLDIRQIRLPKLRRSNQLRQLPRAGAGLHFAQFQRCHSPRPSRRLMGRKMEAPRYLRSWYLCRAGHWYPPSRSQGRVAGCGHSLRAARWWRRGGIGRAIERRFKIQGFESRDCE